VSSMNFAQRETALISHILSARKWLALTIHQKSLFKDRIGDVVSTDGLINSDVCIRLRKAGYERPEG
jgi:hypothetical protein